MRPMPLATGVACPWRSRGVLATCLTVCLGGDLAAQTMLRCASWDLTRRLHCSRCTGYRPIVDAFRPLTSSVPAKAYTQEAASNGDAPGTHDEHDAAHKPGAGHAASPSQVLLHAALHGSACAHRRMMQLLATAQALLKLPCNVLT